MYDLDHLIAVYASDRGLSDHQVREALNRCEITWHDLMLAVYTFSMKVQNGKAVRAFVAPRMAREAREKRNRVALLVAQRNELRKKGSDPEKLKRVTAEIEMIQFRGMTREQLVERAKRVQERARSRS